MSPWLVGAIVVLGFVVISVENIRQARKIRRLTAHLESEEDEHAKTIRMYNEAVAAGHPYRDAAPEAEEEAEEPIYRIFRSMIDSAKWVATNNDGEMAWNCESPVDALESLVAMESGECLSAGCDLLDGHDGDCPDRPELDGCQTKCARRGCTDGCGLTGQHQYHRCLAHADDLPEPSMHRSPRRELDQISRALINGTLSLAGGLPGTGGTR